jgi:high affinity Mn2+ porin
MFGLSAKHTAAPTKPSARVSKRVLALETYYDHTFPQQIRWTLDYQFVANPAFNRDRGPVSVFGTRIHWEF